LQCASVEYLMKINSLYETKKKKKKKKKLLLSTRSKSSHYSSFEARKPIRLSALLLQHERGRGAQPL